MNDDITPAEMQEILEELVADGLAFKGADGRYRLREDITVSEGANGEMILTQRKAS